MNNFVIAIARYFLSALQAQIQRAENVKKNNFWSVIEFHIYVGSSGVKNHKSTGQTQIPLRSVGRDKGC